MGGIDMLRTLRSSLYGAAILLVALLPVFILFLEGELF
jgi:hypothetical protein